MESTVIVYEFEVFDAERRRWKRQARRGTWEAIAKVSGIPIKSTAMVVLASRLDETGFVEVSGPVENA